MKLWRAYWCADCDELNDGARRGVCEKCGSQQVYPVGKFFAKAGVIPVQEVADGQGH